MMLNNIYKHAIESVRQYSIHSERTCKVNCFENCVIERVAYVGGKHGAGALSEFYST